jgi:ElaB/YqjD/DUF883 family membrane-anchored ribosome-binding protein
MSEFNSGANGVNAASAATATHQAFDHAVDKTSETLRPVVDLLVASVHEAVERLADAAGAAADKMETSGAYVKNVQQQATRSARSYVRDQPLTSVGVALATGYLLSWALRKH